MGSMPSRAEELMSQALSDPRAALASGEAILAELDESEYGQRSEVLRAMSMAARHAREIEMSIELDGQAAEAAEMGGLTDLRLMGLLTMSGSLAIGGRIPDSLAVIDKGIEGATDEHLRARFVFQRGAVLHSAGQLTDALTAYEEALPVFREVNDGFSKGQTLNRLGWTYTALGRLQEAAVYLEEALRLALERNEHAAAHGIMHNLGLLASYQGDIPAALDWLERSDALYMEISGDDAPQHVARAEVLISVGRFEEAFGSARKIADAAGARDDVGHESNALLVAARAALMAGRYAEAIEHAEAAADVYDRASMKIGKAEAEAVSVEARFATDGASKDLLADANEVVDRLAAEGLLVATSQARFVAARIAEAIGDHQQGRSHLENVAKTMSGPVEARLQASVARARLYVMDGQPGKASRAARDGLRLMDIYQSTLGATELRMGVEKHGAELGEMGLRLARDSGRPRRVLEWLDLTRARAMRVRPVTPTKDDVVSDQLADLRRVVAELRSPESRDDPNLLRRRRQLEKDIARAERTRRQQRQEQKDTSVGEVIDELDDRVLYELGVIDGRLFAVRVRSGRTTVVEQGEMDRLSGELNHLRFAMRRAARRGRSLDLSVFEPISSALLGNFDLDDGPVLIVPPPQLMSVPWAALPALRGREILVAPSAQMWWRAHQAPTTKSGILVAGGPALEVAAQEVRRVGRIHKGATVLPPGVTVQTVKEGIEGAAIAHIACHAAFSLENPMFSSLRLGDGDLNIYDIERLDDSPGLVVLSACDSGYTEARAGEELAGLTSALLSMGTRTVVASVGLVPDSPATSDLMVDLHKGLVAGLEPAKALAAAQEKAFDDPERFVSAASFICVGA